MVLEGKVLSYQRMYSGRAGQASRALFSFLPTDAEYPVKCVIWRPDPDKVYPLLNQLIDGGKIAYVVGRFQRVKFRGTEWWQFVCDDLTTTKPVSFFADPERKQETSARSSK